MTFKCQHCGGETRIMVSMTVSAPASMAHRFSKKNIAKKEFEIWGVNWDAADFVCQNPKCRRVFGGLRTWIDKLKKENEELKAKLAGYEQKTPLDGRPDKNPANCRCEDQPEGAPDCGCAFGQCEKGLIF